MSSPIPKLTLFPTYSGGPRLQGGLNADSAFYLRPTSFTPAYGVNMPPQTDRTGDSYFFRANANQTLSQVPTSQASQYTQALAFNPASTGGIQTTTPLSAAQAPAIPNKYEDYIRFLEVSDHKFADLMAQPSFRLSNIGPGYLVTTDGNGHVASITADPSMQAAMGRVGVNDPAYLTMNRAEVTMSATLRSANGVTAPDKTPPAGVPNRPVGAEIDSPMPDGIFRLGRPELDGLAVSPRPGLQPQGGLNPVLDRLLQMQPQNPGLAVAGIASQVDVTAARQIAAGQAKLDVTLSPGFQENLTALRTATIEQGRVYTPQVTARQMDGMIPMAPSLPAPTRSAAESGLAGFAQSDFGRDAMGGMADTVSKRGSDGYLPFAFSGGDSGDTGGSGGSANPFAGMMQQGGQSQQQRRQPLYYQA